MWIRNQVRSGTLLSSQIGTKLIFLVVTLLGLSSLLYREREREKERARVETIHKGEERKQAKKTHRDRRRRRYVEVWETERQSKFQFLGSSQQVRFSTLNLYYRFICTLLFVHVRGIYFVYSFNTWPAKTPRTPKSLMLPVLSWKPWDVTLLYALKATPAWAGKDHLLISNDIQNN